MYSRFSACMYKFNKKAAAHQLLDLRQPLFYTRSIVNSYGVYHFEVMKFLALKTTLSE